ncbi:MAG: RluA family pseudouridine synthase [Alphaproteobacteria bacterium]|nr:RluA family pseudouridine synthase [Alphaproteobacteria bacterium]
MAVQFIKVKSEDNDIRVDRWFMRHYPDLKNGQLQRLLRGKNIRVNGKKAETSQHLFAGDEIRVPPLSVSPKSDLPRDLSKADIEFMKSLVIYKDDEVIVLNKPAGLAVQGGSKTEWHIDGMLDALRFEKAEKPHLVHRLDKDTSGVLVLGRTANAAAKLAEAFRSRDAHKVYWAVVVGKPKMSAGKIDAPLSKMSGAKGGEQMRIDFDNGQKAITLYRVVDSLGKKASWLELSPLTGRTHQLRVHAAEALNTPIIGDGKYGGERSFAVGIENNKKLHLHARGIRIPHPKAGNLEIYAELPKHMLDTFSFLGFNVKEVSNSIDYFVKGL